MLDKAVQAERTTGAHVALAYRPDIDGLRAIAVLAVVLFHARLGVLPGGFVGVDIFFVISGYLIASIILKEEAEGRFSLARFYERRIRRIFPALFVVVAVSTALGALLLTPVDYLAFGRSVVATMAFYSNIYFNRQAGYFAPAADTQPLLHTWSLGVEEQFYLLAPFVLLLLQRQLRPWRGLVFAALFAASLGVSAYGVAHEEQWAFYLPHARAFELMCGVALAMGFAPKLTDARLREGLAALGLALMLGPILLYSSATPFPGFAALAPAVGAALLIHTSTAAAPTRIAGALAARPMVFIGKISYSLYLWHWPLLVYAEYYWGSELTALGRIGLMALAVVLATLSYHLVEQPARRATPFLTRRTVFAFGLGSIALAAAVGQTIVATRGLPGRLAPEAEALARATPTRVQLGGLCGFAAEGVRERDTPDCTIGATDAPRASFILWGDSHAASLATTLVRAAQAEGVKGYNVGRGGCPPLLGLEAFGRTFAKCRTGAAEVERLLKADPNIREVVIAARWGLYAEGEASLNEGSTRPRRFADGDVDANRAAFVRQLELTVSRLRAAGKTVTLIGPAPELDFNAPAALLRNAMKSVRADIALPRKAFDARQQAVLPALAALAKQDGVRVIYPHETLCTAQGCAAVENNVALYVDDDHLSPAGAGRLEPMLRRMFQDMHP
jgi:peptidoglycan/LPS O-acetylase OafA/YrhL